MMTEYRVERLCDNVAMCFFGDCTEMAATEAARHGFIARDDEISIEPVGDFSDSWRGLARDHVLGDCVWDDEALEAR